MPSVVITGAGSGIGAAAVVRLDRAGWRVFAGVHQRHDAEILDRQTSERVTVELLDVTDGGSIEELAAKVGDGLGPDGLTALVNNAGEGVAGPLETLPIEQLRHQLEVNVVGQVAVTQQFLPLLRRDRSENGSRVVFVGSMGGLVAVQFAGPYHASKYAIEAIGDAWRQELAPDRIQVAIVEPGPIATPIWSKAAHRLDSLPVNERYERRVAALREQLLRMGKESSGAAEAVDLIEHAVSARRPHTRYTAGLAATFVPKVRRLLPDRLFDVLARHATTKN
ncbi:NADP-dependent 3-hydroxy acid dehydrogenase YdfG [Kribbella amoyensis]|uniref:NADP-dependent 3-hydroxy acid dehydrogenase YdfG n=1 Tax=Kribbella amoyensis TaxID=996641 RepID=A0A561BU81_9ACTN|nr:SDR family NAD(P)-dependent oxidoreductase [Kribbella amoyensis]TWD82464.1 NADP-dependent 3-hydroxy acid dehydrogenase YdfG [Kribbella amoyensis]